MQLNIPKEKIYDLGNFKSVATVRDIPEIRFDLLEVYMPKWIMEVYHGPHS